MKTGRPGAVPRMIVADGGAGPHCGVLALVSLPAWDHGLAVQAPRHGRIHLAGFGESHVLAE